MIAYNLGDGISTAPESPENFVNIASRSNRIHANTGLGIDLYGNGVTPNIAGGGRNYPVLTAAVSSKRIHDDRGDPEQRPGRSGHRDRAVFQCHLRPSGHGEGATPIGSTTVNTDGSGNASFSVLLPLSLEPVPS